MNTFTNQGKEKNKKKIAKVKTRAEGIKKKKTQSIFSLLYANIFQNLSEIDFSEKK